jgi:phosphatidylserine decarboxylase
MSIDRAGAPFVIGALVPTVGCALLGWHAGTAAFGALAAFMVFFFRDPERRIPSAEPDLVLSPADGRVMVAGACEPGAAPPGDWLQLSIFLSPLDVHINRVPVSGAVARVERKPGRYLAAYRPESSTENARTEVWIAQGPRTIVMRQIVGVLARRIVCRIEAGETVRAGARFGLMKFGSRMDVFLPPTAEFEVRVGQRVRAGESIVARLGRAF